MKVAIYARISTNRGEQNINQQVDYCKAYALKENLKVLKVFKDEQTGKDAHRRGYERLWAYLKENKGVGLLVQDTDRLTRDFYHGVELEKFLIENEIRLISLSDTIDLVSPNGKLMFRIKLALNAQYVENLHDKIKVGVARAKAEGKYKGRKKGSKGVKRGKTSSRKIRRSPTKRWNI
ncbi:hypothetical protein LCGC14_2815040 [marine sediment metagenome]|uniref:Resolvase/invertase-type recombinase catalytic domain-containing protein n=1 Tax=marine sediment metagenome TaxID=412755 RepID=A0A0F8V9P1_9ZZZZ